MLSQENISVHPQGFQQSPRLSKSSSHAVSREAGAGDAVATDFFHLDLKTPPSNTGSDSQNVTTEDNCNLETWVDFIQGTAHFTSFELFQQCVQFVIQFDSDCPINYEPGKSFYSGIMWQNSVFAANSVKIGYNIDVETGFIHAWFSMPGGYFHQMDARNHWLLCCGLSDLYNFKCNRIDWKVRDHARRKLPSEILEYARQYPQNIALVHKVSCASELDLISNIEYTTTYLGSRKSEKFLRIYDARPLHLVDAIDWELQCRDEKAQSTFKAFVNIECKDKDGNCDFDMTYELVGKFIAGNVCGAVDFIERTDKNLSRCERLPWWQQFCDECGGSLRLPCGRKTRSLEKTFAWLDKQVFVVISALRDGFGIHNFNSWLQSRLDAMPRRYKTYHENMIYMCKQVSLPNYDNNGFIYAE